MTVDKILALARKELGVREYPPSSNKVKYNTAKPYIMSFTIYH